MNDVGRWEEQNAEHLANAVEWVRLKLRRQIKTSITVTQQPKARFLLGRCRQEPASVIDSVTDIETVSDQDLVDAESAVKELEGENPSPALILLSQRFGLSTFEQKVLLLCIAIELNTDIARLCALAQDNPNQPYPTFALAMALFEDDASWDVVSPERPLRYWRFIEINQPGAQPLTTSALRADERIVNYVKGLNYLDDRLMPLLVPMEAAGSELQLPPSQQAAVSAIALQLRQLNHQQRPPVIQFLGSDSSSKQLVAWQAAEQLGLHLYRLPVELLPNQVGELETFARLWQRESLLLPIALYLDAHSVEGSQPAEGQVPPLHRFLARSNGLFFLGSREIHPGLDRQSIMVDVEKPTPTEQEELWEDILEATATDTPTLLASQFDLNLVSIHQLAQTIMPDSATPQAIQSKLWDACLAHTRPQLDLLAQRLDPKATWLDIVLPAEQTSLLHQIADQIGQRSKVYEDWGFHNRMNRGLGISALFAGESGTGKTMAAEVIANDLRLNLYRIDLSAVVSKYIGETEKNLRRLFDAAEGGGTILFFDEADALFGKRSEVKDSHDRYANIEVNYLLQRMESYRGLAILATNMKSALDHAFVRRLRFIVNFSFPGPAERKVIWRRAFPEEMLKQELVEGLDYDRLARLNFTGGSIHNVVLNAAFLAAQAKTSVTMPVVLAAARTEFRKLDRPINEADFRWQAPTGVTI